MNVHLHCREVDVFLFKFTFIFRSFLYISSHNVGLTTQTPVSLMPVWGATNCGLKHWIYTMAGLPYCVWSAQCQGHRLRQHTIEHRQIIHIHPRIEIKIFTLPGIEPEPPVWKAETPPNTPRRWTKFFMNNGQTGRGN